MSNMPSVPNPTPWLTDFTRVEYPDNGYGTQPYHTSVSR